MSTGNKNSNMVIMTATSIVIALGAVSYALYVQNKSVQQVSVAVPTPEITQMEYTADSNNPVVMSLNGEDITRQEIIEHYESLGQKLPANQEVREIFPFLQEQYVVNKLLEQGARNNGFTEKTPEVAKKMNFALSQILRASYMQSIAERNITDNDVKNAYKDIIESAPVVMERRASHILVDSAEKAQALIKKINDGADFEELAKENSQGPTGPNGGDLGYFAASDMVPEFSQAAFGMDVGDVSAEPVQTQFGFHIIKVTGEKEREKPSFEAVKGQLKSELQQAVLAEKVNEMRSNATVTLYDYDGQPIAEAEDGDNNASTEQPSVESGDKTTDESAATQPLVTEEPAETEDNKQKDTKSAE